MDVKKYHRGNLLHRCEHSHTQDRLLSNEIPVRPSRDFFLANQFHLKSATSSFVFESRPIRSARDTSEAALNQPREECPRARELVKRNCGLSVIE